MYIKTTSLNFVSVFTHKSYFARDVENYTFLKRVHFIVISLVEIVNITN
jgi:hypothetical protein